MLLKNIYEEYKQDVFKYLVSLTHDISLSEDLVSETFLGALKSLHKFKGQSTIKTWLFSIARNKWYEHLRKEKPTISLDDLSYNYLLSESDLDDSIIKKELSNKILALLDSESPRTKDIILMRIEGYSYFEIGKKHNISESSARVIDYRIKKKIKNILAKEANNYE
ncbi:RNA polymerase sigma factor [Terrisporobacter sp.]|uniref:RNA polymerase sigma factor n=1 Tax=Terrisporobacter sp. TaxID=1965305 RepID=UPI00260AF045|nr:RNA polymerase sigma factor [Terrisporobacter sp.]